MACDIARSPKTNGISRRPFTLRTPLSGFKFPFCIHPLFPKLASARERRSTRAGGIQPRTHSGASPRLSPRRPRHLTKLKKGKAALADAGHRLAPLMPDGSLAGFRNLRKRGRHRRLLFLACCPSNASCQTANRGCEFVAFVIISTKPEQAHCAPRRTTIVVDDRVHAGLKRSQAVVRRPRLGSRAKRRGKLDTVISVATIAPDATLWIKNLGPPSRC